MIVDIKLFGLIIMLLIKIMNFVNIIKGKIVVNVLCIDFKWIWFLSFCDN